MPAVLVRRVLPPRLAFQQRQRDVLVETVYEIARIECRRLAGAPSAEFRKAVDALEAFDAAEAARAETEYCAG